MSKPALGRGLGALLGSSLPPTKSPDAAPPAPAAGPVADNRERVERAPLTRIRPCPLQPRKDFSSDALRELADSIMAQGIVQPLIVRCRGDGFELIAGERRWRAAQMLGLTEHLVAQLQNRGATPARGKSGSLPLTRDSHVADLERRLQERFGTRVDLRYRQGKGALQIHFFNDTDLERLLEIIGVKVD